MKNPKKPTYSQKQIISKAGLDPKEYGVIESRPDQIVIINRKTNEVKTLEV